ncbi:MAG TPA: hypothetical protein VK468_04465 [Pyrinomonadaceae bacterium]|nr:hypothetical protein [Pyrinomonadaceae bacterium]
MKSGKPFLPKNRSGIAIDTVVIIANIFLFPIVTARIGGLFDESFRDEPAAFMTLGGLMMFILAGRMFGLYLKRFSLQSRSGAKAETEFPLYFFILNVPVLVLTAAFVMVYATTILADIGIGETTYSGRPKESAAASVIGAIVMFAIMCTEIYFLYRLSRPLSRRERQLKANGSWMFTWLGETAADFGLFAYMIVWQVFYNYTVSIFLVPAPNMVETFEFKIFGAVFMFMVFLMFYVSPRTVFLIEDRKYLGTWVLIFGVYLSSIIAYW